MRAVLLALIKVYRVAFSWLVGGYCRFVPSCSVYTEEAVDRYGAWRGFVLGTRRLLKCHPFSKGGYDPVP